MITCGHCGGRHATVAEVRACAGGPDPVAPGLFDHEPDPAEAPSPAPDQPARSAPALPPDWERLAGPDALGRSVVVRPGQAAPRPWLSARRVPADDVDELQAAWSQREPIVIELADDLPETGAVVTVPYWQLSAGFELPGDRRSHLVLSNSVDGREPDRPTCRAIGAALGAGGRASGPGDVVDAAGTALWCDGGPFAGLPLDAPVVPAVHLERGILRPLGTAAPTADLAPDQLAAVAHHGGGARIIAPAGSGKTRVLTERARHLIADLGVATSAVCLVAFNVRAREEMAARTTDLSGLQIRTLNSLALAIANGTGPFLRPGTRTRPLQVIDERRVRSILDGLVRTRRTAMADPFAAWMEALTASRLGLRSPVEVEAEFGTDTRDFAAVVPLYRQLLADEGLVDFDEQVLAAIEVLLTDPAARTQARSVCRLLLVDEFQDLTPAHVLLVRLLAGPPAEVFGVGDDDQTIYGHVGASPDWLIDFARLFPGAAHHDLHVNYRCPLDVVSAASNLVGRNRRRVPKDIHAGPDARPGGLRIALDLEPRVELTDHLKTLLGDGAAPADIAVLTRVNATLLAPMVTLHDVGVPITRPVESGFAERTGVAAALAWVRLATAVDGKLPGDALAVATRRPPRGLSRRVVDWVAEKRSLGDLDAMATRLNDERDRTKIEALVEDLARVRSLASDDAPTVDLLVAIRDDVGLGRALDTRLDASRRSVTRSAHGDDLAALVSIAPLQPDPARFGDWLVDQLRQIPDDPDGVHLATVHRTKGREWPHVVIYEASAGLFPHRLAEDREEERRVFHVGLTRCSRSVLVLAGASPSPFIAELTAPGPPPPEPDPARAAATPHRGKAPPADALGDARLREQLKTWRHDRSRTDGVPAYVVFNDATLHELARLRPATRSDLLAVPGIGPNRADRYGDALLALIQEG